MIRVALGILVGLTIGAVLFTLQARARPPVPGPVFKAVRAEFPTRPLRVQAFDVVSCETGGTYSIYSGYGKHDYWGLFQFGGWARSRYGFGWSARAQAHAAYRYWLDSRWSGWECQPRNA